MQYAEDENDCGCIVNTRFFRTGENLVVKNLGNGKDQDPLNPCGGFQLTIGVLDPYLKKNCDELILNSSNVVFKEKMALLKNSVNDTVEKVFPIYNGNHVGNNFTNPLTGPVVPETEQSVSVPYHEALKATAHNHLTAPDKRHIGTFSPNDLIGFANLLTYAEENQSPIKKEEFAFYLVCSEGNYALKITDFDKLYNFAVKYGTNKDFQDKIDKFYKENKMVHGKEKVEQNIGFLKLMKKHDIGVDYYEADENFENWKKLELNSSENNINKIPCN
ncbi:hypothetical protein GV828_01400 [Flavobacterium sp. NST-5]|uniref:Uncharacterized protein n=1 Tax=Flavobacterium ichthyis TaxID=2698827 RepID=A0ABW9Z589_9FLAO|nr:hypothetical protein [Flavobacterium ichthyis]NBL63849.1 hypothetical protein [Flavobacterium ichthyis]